MSSQGPENQNATRRLDRAIRRHRLRVGLMISGVAFVTVGILMGTMPFGPPVSSTVAILKADPHAGLWLAQALPRGTARHLGSALVVVGVALLVAFALLGDGKSRDDGNQSG